MQQMRPKKFKRRALRGRFKAIVKSSILGQNMIFLKEFLKNVDYGKLNG